MKKQIPDSFSSFYSFHHTIDQGSSGKGKKYHFFCLHLFLVYNTLFKKIITLRFILHLNCKINFDTHSKFRIIGLVIHRHLISLNK